MLRGIDSLLEFCHNYDVVACYGAKRYGKYVKSFLESNDICISFFVVTEKSEDCCEGIPVYELSELRNFTGNLGIVLTLSEKYQQEVTDLVQGFLGKEQGLFPCSMEMFQCVYDMLYMQERQRCLLPSVVYAHNQEYEATIADYKKLYRKIEVRNIDCRYLGMIGAEWPHWCCQCINEKFFYLYYPVTFDEGGPNEEILYRLSGNGIGIIHRRNIEFWRYFISHYRAFFDFFDNKISIGYYQAQGELRELLLSGHRWLELSDDDENFGRNLKEKMNIGDNYVCISCRDNDYSVDNKDYNVTKQRIGKLRNSCIETYSLAVEYLKQNDIQAVRMGAMVKQPYEHDNVIDYAFMHYSPFMDIFLSYHCNFFVANLSGIIAIPILCGKPIVLINVALFTVRYDATPFTTNDTIIVCKKMWDTKNNRFLTFKEMLEYEINSRRLDMNVAEGTSLLYERDGIVPVDNTPEEILAAIKEMNERLEGKRKYTPEDEYLQHKVKGILEYVDFKENILFDFRFCSEFLHANTWLLE